MPKLYGAKPVDEVKLRSESRPYVNELNGELPSSAYLKSMTQVSGVELATMVLYQAIMVSSQHKPFIEAVQAEPEEAMALDPSVKILVLPAYFYKENPEVGGDGQIVADVASACGLKAEVLPTSSMGAVSENAVLLKNWLKGEASEKIWIVTLSKGAAELRCFLQDNLESPEINKIRGWLNIGSLANGCHLVDHMLSTAGRRLKTRAMAAAIGADYKGFHELRTDHSLWQVPCRYPSGMRMVQVMPVPLLCHVQKPLVSRYLRLQHLGPNDGMVLLRDSIIENTEIYPLWSSDHFFRSFQISPLLYQLFRQLLQP